MENFKLNLNFFFYKIKKLFIILNKVLNKKMKFSIRSDNVILENFIEPQKATIFIKNEKIIDIYNENKDKYMNFSFEEYPLTNFKDKLIFPGCIDINTQNHASYDWEDILETTRLFAQGGITTIINQPLMRNEKYKENEIISLINEFEKFSEDSFIDFGLIAILNEKSLENLEEIIEKNLAIGFKLFLKETIQDKISFPKTDSELVNILENFSDKIEKIGKKFCLFIEPSFATNKEIFLSSPYRVLTPDQRINPDIYRHSKTVDGHHGDYSGTESYDSKEKESDESNNDNVINLK